MGRVELFGEHAAEASDALADLCRWVVGERQAQAVVGRCGERLAVTTLRLLPQQRIGYLQGAAVLPEQRRTGLYRATILHRLALLRELDYQHAVVWANARTSAQGCASMGFTPHCSGSFFEWRRAS